MHNRWQSASERTVAFIRIYSDVALSGVCADKNESRRCLTSNRANVVQVVVVKDPLNITYSGVSLASKAPLGAGNDKRTCSLIDGVVLDGRKRRNEEWLHFLSVWCHIMSVVTDEIGSSRAPAHCHSSHGIPAIGAATVRATIGTYNYQQSATRNFANFFTILQ
jgi:hypothetical protein